MTPSKRIIFTRNGPFFLIFNAGCCPRGGRVVPDEARPSNDLTGGQDFVPRTTRATATVPNRASPS